MPPTSGMLDWAVLLEATLGTAVCALSQGFGSGTLAPLDHSPQARVEVGPDDHGGRCPSSRGVMDHAGRGGRLPCGLSCLHQGWCHWGVCCLLIVPWKILMIISILYSSNNISNYLVI